MSSPAVCGCLVRSCCFDGFTVPIVTTRKLLVTVAETMWTLHHAEALAGCSGDLPCSKAGGAMLLLNHASDISPVVRPSSMPGVTRPAVSAAGAGSSKTTTTPSFKASPIFTIGCRSPGRSQAVRTISRALDAAAESGAHIPALTARSTLLVGLTGWRSGLPTSLIGSQKRECGSEPTSPCRVPGALQPGREVTR